MGTRGRKSFANESTFSNSTITTRQRYRCILQMTILLHLVCCGEIAAQMGASPPVQLGSFSELLTQHEIQLTVSELQIKASIKP